MKKSKKIRQNALVVFDPHYGKKNPEAYKDSLVQIGEEVIYLGDIPNSPSHCIVAKHTGEVVWMLHTSDLKEVSED